MNTGKLVFASSLPLLLATLLMQGSRPASASRAVGVGTALAAGPPPPQELTVTPKARPPANGFPRGANLAASPADTPAADAALESQDSVSPDTNAAGALAAGTSAFRFVSWSDVQLATNSFAALSNVVKTLSPAFTVFPGDVCQTIPASLSCWNDWTNAMNGYVNNGISGISFISRGNHDAQVESQ